jgi:hypothetical protein
MAKKPELDDFRVPYFDGKKIAKFALADFDPGAKPFSTGTKDGDRHRCAARRIAGVPACPAHAARAAGAARYGHER